MTLDDGNWVYIATPNGENEGESLALSNWVAKRGHQVYITKYNWRKLAPNECHAQHGRLLGKWLRIKKKVKGVHINEHLPEADMDFLMLLKLSWGGA